MDQCTRSGISINRHFDESINNKIVGITPVGLAAALNKLDILQVSKMLWMVGLYIMYFVNSFTANSITVEQAKCTHMLPA